MNLPGGRDRYTLFVLIFAAVVAMLPNSVLFPAAPDIANHLHVSVSWVGLMVTTYSVAYIIATPFLGAISDHVGRKAILAGGLTIFAVGGLFPLVTSDFGWILAGRAVMGVGSAGILPMVDSVIGDAYEAGPARRAALAGFSAAIAVADALVPFLGGVLDAWQWRAVFAVYAFGFVAAVCCVFMTAPPLAHKEEHVGLKNYLKGLQVAWRLPSVVTALSSAVLFGMAYFGVCSLLPLALPANSGLQNGVLFLPIGVCWVLVSGWLSKRSHLPNIHMYAGGAALLLCAATLWMATIHSWWLLLIVAAVWGIGSAVTTTMYTWVIGDDTPAQVRGAMNAVFNAAYVLGFSVGAPVFVALKQWFGYACSTSIAGCLMLVSAVIAFRWLKSPHAMHANHPTGASWEEA